MGIPLILGAEILYKIEGPLILCICVGNLAISSLQLAISQVRLGQIKNLKVEYIVSSTKPNSLDLRSCIYEVCTTNRRLIR